MPVADVPGSRTALDHHAVIVLRILHNQGVLFRVEVRLAAVARISRDGAAQLGEQRDDFVLARFVYPACRLSVLLRVLAVRLEALQSAPRGWQGRGACLP